MWFLPSVQRGVAAAVGGANGAKAARINGARVTREVIAAGRQGIAVGAMTRAGGTTGTIHVDAVIPAGETIAVTAGIIIVASSVNSVLTALNLV